MVGGDVGEVLGHGAVDGAVRVEVAGDGVDGARPLGGGEERGRERRPGAFPLGVVAGVGAVVEDVGAVGRAGQGVRVGGVEGGVRDAGDPGVAAAAGDDGDVGAALGEQGGDVPAHGPGADDQVTVGHDWCSNPRAALSVSTIVARLDSPDKSNALVCGHRSRMPG